jgi:hypothetical protein
MNRLKYLFLLVLFLSFNLTLRAQQAYAKSDKYKIRIGDQAQIELNANVPKGERLIWPIFKDSLGTHFDIVNESAIDTIADSTGNGMRLIQKINITSFDSGRHTLPVFSFDFIKATGDTNSIISDGLLIDVLTIPVDTTKAIKDIRDVLDVPFEIGEYIPWIIGGLVLVAILVAGIYLWLNKKKPAAEIKPAAPKIPAWQLALSALDVIEKEKVWQEGKSKQYQSDITDTLRKYIEEQFKLPAMESTTDETLMLLRNNDFSQEAQQQMRQLLTLADLIKFAKQEALPADHERSMRMAREFIMTTKPAEVKPTSGKEAGKQ